MTTPDIRALRDAFGAFATGITIITATTAEGASVGFTANSFTSVSLTPPLLLVCAAHGVSALPAIRASRAFGVNILAVDQEAISRRFTQRSIDRFAGANWHHATLGVPLLTGACATFECTVQQDIEAGDHVIFIGHIKGFTADPAHAPLLYHRGRYAGLHSSD
ncbi:flavin reductase family protein [Sandaracinobacteroides saxicola]|uniref:Flavin reductase family protein n=1 Tax=Sandaracinobacteroides saxicola TaxID=2759707 RepID=A0A7G5IGU4_9SPHN|nr:flavin reductase family protein [Sandaracinobacteroides saxicola]QMW22586.1 flavin reductase family protein [Sandaracinobacteroides saxicola]